MIYVRWPYNQHLVSWEWVTFPETSSSLMIFFILESETLRILNIVVAIQDTKWRVSDLFRKIDSLIHSKANEKSWKDVSSKFCSHEIVRKKKFYTSFCQYFLFYPTQARPLPFSLSLLSLQLNVSFWFTRFLPEHLFKSTFTLGRKKKWEVKGKWRSRIAIADYNFQLIVQVWWELLQSSSISLLSFLFLPNVTGKAGSRPNDDWSKQRTNTEEMTGLVSIRQFSPVQST